jgi:hypothetical protein
MNSMLYQLSSAVVPPFREALHQIVEESGIWECRVDLEPAEGSMVLMNDEVAEPWSFCILFKLVAFYDLVDQEGHKYAVPDFT